MAKPRLPNASFATLIQQAVQELNPEEGLTQEELVDYVYSQLGLSEESIQQRVEQFLADAIERGALVKTDEDLYQVTDPEEWNLEDVCCKPKPTRKYRQGHCHCCCIKNRR